MRIALRVIGKLAFNQFGTEHKPGDLINPDVFTQWPAGVVDARMANGWVKWEPVPGDDDPAPIEDPNITDLDKNGLLLYADQRFNIKLDARMSEGNLREQIAAMADRQSKLALVSATRNAGRVRALAEAANASTAEDVKEDAKPVVPSVPVAIVKTESDEPPASGDGNAEGPGGDQTQNPTGAGDSEPVEEVVEEVKESAPPADAGETAPTETTEQAPPADAGDTSASETGQEGAGATSAS